MGFEVDSDPLIFVSGNAADEAVVFVIVLEELLCLSHGREGVDDDPRNDGGRDQINNQNV